VDTTKLVGAVTLKDLDAHKFLFDRSKVKLTNEYVIKEVRRVLGDEYGFSQTDINYAIDDIRENCNVVANPPKIGSKNWT
jgi:predicted nucleic acid-binding protein